MTALVASTFTVPAAVDPAHPAAAWRMRCVNNLGTPGGHLIHCVPAPGGTRCTRCIGMNQMDARLDAQADAVILAPSGTAAELTTRKALCAAFKGARMRLTKNIRLGVAPAEPVRPLYVPPPPPPPPPLHARVSASVAALPIAGVRSGLGLVRAVDSRCRELMVSVLGRLPALSAPVLPFSPAYVAVGGSAVLVYRDIVRDNREVGFLEVSRPLLVYCRLLSPTRSLLRGLFEEGIHAFLDSPRFLRALAHLPLRFSRAVALMRPLMSQLGVSLGLLPEPPAPIPVRFYRWLVQFPGLASNAFEFFLRALLLGIGVRSPRLRVLAWGVVSAAAARRPIVDLVRDVRLFSSSDSASSPGAASRSQTPVSTAFA
ncbi:hypothetical protein N7486_003269 [Penicillium sp. IBT 16267x]|nr:hypothetical protein N7486_009520 [Penicillium sp. IBT 16267x]KAJ6111034.1 hypothetical protein N7486_003269 [Penicillium sp. IBT 16267x]